MLEPKKLQDYALYVNKIVRPFKNALFCTIPVSCSNFNPQNTKCMDACPDRFSIGMVKIFAFLGLEQN